MRDDHLIQPRALPAGLDDDDDTSPSALGIRLARACAPAFVLCQYELAQPARVEFSRAFLATVSGMVEQAIGHADTAAAFAATARLPSAAGRVPTQ